MTYKFEYDEASPYARAVGLVEAHRRPEGTVVVDLGCGYGQIAEPLAALGLEYVGIDADQEAVRALRTRGFAASVGDIGDPVALAGLVEAAVAGRSVAAICMLDAAEHLAEPEPVLSALSELADNLGGATLVVSIPNVTHFDLGVKLLLGRWDVTPTGLLDRTHLRFFSEAHLTSTMARCGWREVGAADFELYLSDQHFPEDAVALDRVTPIGSVLANLRSRAGEGALVNQFVRAYEPADVVAEAVPVQSHAPSLSVLVRTRGDRPETFAETLLSLAAQTRSDFEVLVLAHDVDQAGLSAIAARVAEFDAGFSSRVRVVPVHGGGRARPLIVGAELAAGHHLVALDDDDLAFAHWVETLAEGARRAPSRVVHVQVAVQAIAAEPGPTGYRVLDRPRCPYPATFALLDHLADNRTPNCGYAVPRSLVADLGEVWDETLPVYEDWEYLLRAAALCGVENAEGVGALVRVLAEGDRSTTEHSRREWDEARVGVVARVDARPLLLGPGSMSALRALVRSAEAGGGGWRSDVTESEHHAASAQLRAARLEIDELRASTSWRVTRPLRALSARLRRLGSRPGRAGAHEGS